MTPEQLRDLLVWAGSAMGVDIEAVRAAGTRPTSRGTWLTPLAQLPARPGAAPVSAAGLATLLLTCDGIAGARAQPGGHVEITLDPPTSGDLAQLCDDLPDVHLGGGVDALGPGSSARDERNVAYRVLHAHARLCRRRRTAAASGVVADTTPRPELLTHEAESALLTTLLAHREALVRAGRSRDRRPWVGHLRGLADRTHAWCEACPSRPLGDAAETDVHRARGWLDETTRSALARGLAVLDVAAPSHI